MSRSFLLSLLAGGLLAFGNFAAQALPAGDKSFVSDHFSGSATCAECHNGLRDSDGTDVSIESDWKTSMMANAAIDPFWQAKVASEMKRNPSLEHELQHVCTRCHAPMANVEADLQGVGLTLFEHGEIDPTHPYFDEAMDGVSCTLCHQIEDSELLGTEAADTGGFTIDPSSRVSYGPVPAPQINPMLNSSGFTPVHSAHMSSSEACAACHDLRTPFVDGDGLPVSIDGLPAHFPEQMVYSEWENSIYAGEGEEARSCQDCHMPATDGVKLASRPSRLNPVDDFSRHQFLGANTVMMDIIDQNSEALGATSADFGPTIARTRAHLATAANVEIVQHTLANGRLTVDVKVSNNGGHKLPSGYPSRRAFLNFRVSDAAGNTLFESGRMNADGSIEGVAADTDRGTFEPHYQVIDSPDQVQVYESVMANTDGEPTYTLMEAANYLKDNRLTPRGFDKAQVPAKVGVYGQAQQDADFNQGSDTLRYQVPLGAAAGPYQVEVRLQYQPLGHAYVQDLLEDRDEPAVARFADMYEASSLRAELIARTSISIEGSAPARLSDDFNADGRSDVLMRNSLSGKVVQWQMDGASFSEFSVARVGSDWLVTGVDDLGGDGKADIVLRRISNGQMFLWEMDGDVRTASYIGPLALDWKVVGIGDLGGDGKADIVLRRASNGQMYLWEMDGNVATGSNIGRLALDWKVVGVADLGGDGKADIILRHTSTGQVRLWEMDGNVATGSNIGRLALDWKVVGVADLGGDGKADIVLRRTSNGQMYLWEMDGNVRTGRKIGALSLDWVVVQLGDFDGDGKADMLLRDRDTGNVALWQMDGASIVVVPVSDQDPEWQVAPAL